MNNKLNVNSGVVLSGAIKWLVMIPLNINCTETRNLSCTFK